MSKSFWEWAGFFSRVLGGLLIVSVFVGLAMGWVLSDAVAYSMTFFGLGLIGFGLFANAVASDK